MKISKKAISLIVLVITIIVMIILAAAIIVSLQSSGIIGRANEAKKVTEASNAKEVVAMADAVWQRRKVDGYNSFKDYAESKLENAGYSLEGNGGISLSDSGAINIIYIGSDNRQAIIPEGFTVSGVSTEDTVTEGLVIKDKDGNEFVWVPVDVPEGKNFDEVFARIVPELESNFMEPYSELSLTNDLTGEWAEEAAMRKSVKQYGGFYIGRYEAGTTTVREGGKTNGTTEVVVQKNKPVYNVVGWGPSMKKVTGTLTDRLGNNHGKGAVELSREMYRSSQSVVSTLCYGVQWDATMNFMKDVPNPNVDGKMYVEDSTGMGVYDASTPANTGSNDAYKVKNIYDMAGNVIEWTMEILEESPSFSSRVLRGGAYPYEGDIDSASYRGAALYTNETSDCYGFRPALYIK